MAKNTTAPLEPEQVFIYLCWLSFS